MLTLDNTKRSELNSCPRKYYWSYIRNLKPTQGSTALRYGITWHAAMEGLYGHIKKHGWTHDGGAVEAAISAAKDAWAEQSTKQSYFDDYRTLENCLQSLLSYLAHFNHDEGMLKVNFVERRFKIKLELDAMEMVRFPRVSKQGIVFAGRLDADITLTGRPWQMEQKTTGQSLSYQKFRLHRNPQNIGYAYANRCISEEPSEGCLIVLHQLTAYKSKKTETWGAPKIDFDRVPQIYTDGDLESWRESFLNTAEIILRNMEMGIWPMNYDSCYQYGQCKFTNLCEQNAPLGQEITEGFFEDEAWEPAPGAKIIEERR